MTTNPDFPLVYQDNNGFKYSARILKDHNNDTADLEFINSVDMLETIENVPLSADIQNGTYSNPVIQ